MVPEKTAAPGAPIVRELTVPFIGETRDGIMAAHFRVTHPGMELLFEDLSPTLADHLRTIGKVQDFID